MKMSKEDIEIIQNRYSTRFVKYGYSPKTLGWDKGKQDLRYHILLEDYNLENKSILDIGCGFADANILLKKKVENYTYLGVDIVKELIETATEIYKDDSHIDFILGDFLNLNLNKKFDIVIASGIFNFKLTNEDNYDFINSFMKKAYNLSKEGISFDFLSDKVDFQYKNTFHSSPSKILDMAYQFSKNVSLKNNYMPFEFAITIFKDESFEKKDTIFKRFKNEKSYYRFH
ncbi:hypothetical protein CP965_07315 [Halarcobacter mediterraneus]|uniref:Methyltransferase domain-containing protein n=1 Tax=Halarcobacter mediterraneus TaxID=2023153 RepID=A0A4Q1B0J2_9BACT|nr:class I SAM-dependent methyltransferase [Halarcobacter mediterraneus]RXK13599.1 hypothetical protein CP965_07315 [Halarcobacter mediterraneus]